MNKSRKPTKSKVASTKRQSVAELQKEQIRAFNQGTLKKYFTYEGWSRWIVKVRG